MADRLTAKQRLFIAAYVDRWNGAEAARRAGYSEKTAREQASRLLTNVNVSAEIESHIQAIMPKGEVLTRLAARARATIADVLALPSADLPESEPERRRESWSLDLVKARRTGGIDQIKKLKSGKYGDEIETYDPLPALELLGKHLKLFSDDTGILKYLDLGKLTPEQLQRIADGDDPLAVLINTPSDSGQGPA